jgi:hypothetical protein
MANTKLRRRLHRAESGTIGSDGTGVATIGKRTVLMEFRITKAFPRGAYYDKAGKAYVEPSPPRKSVEQAMAEIDPAMEPVFEPRNAFDHP